MAALYDRYAGLFLHTNAAFLCERARRAPSSADARGIGVVLPETGRAHRAYATLRGRTLEPHGRYLLALACHRLDKDAEAEAASLLPDRAARAAGPRESAQLLRSKASPVPPGAAGLYVLEVSARRAIGRTMPLRTTNWRSRKTP